MFKKNSKMSLLLATIILIMGSIGTGIFFKNSEILAMNWNSLLLLIFSWIFSSIGILLFGISLSRTIRNTKISDLGIVSWIEQHNQKTLAKAIKNFINLYYMPLIKFGVIFYAVIAFINAIGWSDVEWYEIFLIMIAAITVIQLTGGTWIKTTKFTNKIFIFTQILPILFVVIYGIYVLSTEGGNIFQILPNETPSDNIVVSNPLLANSPYIGLLSSIPSIYFVYDGFYKVANMHSDMKEPHKIKYVILFGMIALVLINIIMSIFLIAAFNGNLNSSENINIVKTANWLIIGSALGNFNLNAIMASRLYEIEYFDKTRPNWIQKYFKINNSSSINPYNGSLLSYLVTLMYFIPLSLIGTFWFFNFSSYGYQSEYTNNLLSFNDLLINWSSVFIFSILLLPIGANLKKCNKKEKIFDITTIIVMIIPLLFIVFETLYNTIFMISNDYWIDEYKNRIMVGNIFKVLLLIFNFSFIVIPWIYFKKKEVILTRSTSF